MPDCGGGWRAWRPGCPPPVQGAGCRATSRLARGVSRREKSSGKGVPTALPGGGRNPPAGWSTLRSPARNATPPCPGGWVQRTREVIDIPVAPAEVTEHVFMARLCPLCRKRRLPQAPLRGLAVGRQRLGGQPGEPDCHPAGRGAAARKDNSMVSANVPPVETERWGHRPGRPSGCPAWRNGCR